MQELKPARAISACSKLTPMAGRLTSANGRTANTTSIANRTLLTAANGPRSERFKKYCSRSAGNKMAVFFGFGFVSAQLQGSSRVLQTCAFAKDR
jgi:hypothetical protein